MGRFLEALKTACGSNAEFMGVAQTVTKKEEVLDFFRDAIQASKELVAAEGRGVKIVPEDEAISSLRDSLLEEMDSLSKDEQERMAALFDFIDIRKMLEQEGIPVIVMVPMGPCGRPGCPNCQPDSSSLN